MVTRTWKVKALSWLVLILLIYGATELFAFAAYSLATRTLFSFRTIEAEREQWVQSTEEVFGIDDIPARYRIRKELVHPCLGYVHDPAVEESSPYGISDVSPIQTRSADKVIIGFFGGSGPPRGELRGHDHGVCQPHRGALP